MSDLDDVRDDLARLNSFHPQTLLSALMEADSEIKRIEKTRDEFGRAHDIIRARADLHARRCELALAILRDDEAGLTQAKLQEIADVIWPQPIDLTQQPTDLSAKIERNQMYGKWGGSEHNLPHEVVRSTISSGIRDSEPTFYITPTWGERRGWELIRSARCFFAAIRDVALRGGLDYGELLTAQLQEWDDKSEVFCKKFSDVE